MTFSERLKELRDAGGMTQEQLAQAAGMSVGNVRNYEQGIRLPTFPVVVKLAKALGTDCTTFADCTDVTGDEKTERKPTKKPPKKGGKK
jgi:transcriptional regulator with XRE-family HTH domain